MSYPRDQYYKPALNSQQLEPPHSPASFDKSSRRSSAGQQPPAMGEGYYEDHSPHNSYHNQSGDQHRPPPAASPYYNEKDGNHSGSMHPSAAFVPGGDSGSYYGPQQTGYYNGHDSAYPVVGDPEQGPHEKAGASPAKRRKKTCADFICCPCCCCLPMWTRYICCILLCIIIALAIVVAVLASRFKAPSIDMNGVAADPNGRPAFERAADLSFTVNLGLEFGVNNPNIEWVTLASVSTKAYYPTAPDRVVATGYLENIVIHNYGVTNFTYPIQLHYDQATDTNLSMLRDITQRCSSGQQIQVDADISVVISLIGIHIPIPTIHRPIAFDCPIPKDQLASLAPSVGQIPASGIQGILH